jgi:hypothetical protein
MSKAMLASALLLVCSLAHAGISEHLDRALQWSGNQLNRWGDEDREKARNQARSAPRGAEPQVLIRRSGVDEFGDPRFANGFTIAGQTLKSGDTLQRALDVLGPSSRKGYNGTQIWDALGITVQSEWPHIHDFNPADKREDQPITWVYLHLNASGSAVLDAGDTPAKLFSGYLELDQVGIDSKTTLKDIRTLADREGLRGAHAYLYCSQGRTDCYIGEVPGKPGIEVKVYVNDMSDAQSTLHGLMINF